MPHCQNPVEAASTLGQNQHFKKKIYKYGPLNYLISKSSRYTECTINSLIQDLSDRCWAQLLPKAQLSKYEVKLFSETEKKFITESRDNFKEAVIDFTWNFVSGLVRVRDSVKEQKEATWLQAFKCGLWGKSFETEDVRINKAILGFLTTSDQLFSKLLDPINQKLKSELKQTDIGTVTDDTLAQRFKDWKREFHTDHGEGDNEYFQEEHPKLKVALDLRQTVNEWKSRYETKYNAFFDVHKLNTVTPKKLQDAQKLGANVRFYGGIALLVLTVIVLAKLQLSVDRDTARLLQYRG